MDDGPMNKAGDGSDSSALPPQAPAGYLVGKTGVAAKPREMGFVRHAQAHAAPEQPAGGFIRYAGDSHIMTVAPTGTGKTSGPVICNALEHPGQLIVLDIKGEVYRATGDARRAMGQDVHVLDLRDGATATGSLNPLHLAARFASEPAVVARSFAAEFVERGVDERDPFWNNWAETVLSGGVAYLLADCSAEECHLGTLFDLFNSDDPVYAIACLLDTGKVKNPSAHAAFAGLLNLPERDTRPSVIASTTQYLRAFDSALVRRLTTTTSLDIDGLIAGKPMSIYFIVPPTRLQAYRSLLRSWIASLLFAFSQRDRVPEHRTLLLCDEIAALGRLDAFVMAATLMRSWGVTLWSFWQNLAQLDIYGIHARTLVDNAGVVQLFGVNNRRMAEEFAQLVGGVDPDDIMAMSRDEQILLAEGKLVPHARKLRYWEDMDIGAGRHEPVR